ncbi:hypothetical protein IFT84_10310 [Rhizobium sp. CFBP 8762]|uniref:hypothetical protein n=1 Tax=Rhizobium sp. CFBP 8762 TaxID=2775279 RepID=UPI00178758ED|nr:hypothetical protein [Rhizobium sp. CFBP 8762]MBD8554916.1 hypothetical protein [Rhizobium sp. CFBP 8762]
MTFPNAPISRMEPAIIDRLRLAFPEKTFAIERVPQVMTLSEFDRCAKHTPFIGLAWTGLRPDTSSGRVLNGKMLWRLILINRASNSLETRFKGDTRAIGLDAMVEVAVVLMQGAVFKDIGYASVTLANSLIADGWSDDKIAIAQVDFEVSFSVTPAVLNLLTPDEFRAIGATWIGATGISATGHIDPHSHAIHDTTNVRDERTS